MDELTFEQAYARLVELLGQLESGELTLEESIMLFEEGQWITRQCIELLDSEELDIQQFDEDDTLDS